MKLANVTCRFLILATMAVVSFGLFAQNKKKQKEEKEIDAFVKTIVSRNSVSSSDTLSITYRLYTTLELRDLTDMGTYIRDFHQTDATPHRQVYKEEKVKGVIYKVVDLRKFILQPRKNGVLVIPKRKFILEYARPTGRTVVDVWGNKYQQSVAETKEVEGDEVQVRVMDYTEM